MCSCYLKLRFQPKSFYKRRMDMVSSLKASRDVRLGSEMKADFTYKYKDLECDDCAQQEYLFFAMLNTKFTLTFISRFLICIAILRASMSSSVLFREKSHCSQQLPRKKKHSWFHEHMEKFWRRYHLTSQKQRPFRQSDGLS